MCLERTAVVLMANKLNFPGLLFSEDGRQEGTFFVVVADTNLVKTEYDARKCILTILQHQTHQTYRLVRTMRLPIMAR